VFALVSLPGCLQAEDRSGPVKIRKEPAKKKWVLSRENFNIENLLVRQSLSKDTDRGAFRFAGGHVRIFKEEKRGFVVEQT
jgi:hypothetical protein